MKTLPRLGSPRGLTLVELMVIIAIVGVLLTLAAPSFRDFILMQRLKAVHAQLVTDLQFARSEAAARNQIVNMRVIGAGNNGVVSCYTLFTDTGHAYASGPSQRCDCRQPEGSRCTEAGTTEIRTVLVPRSLGVVFSVPAGGASSVGFEPTTGGMALTFGAGAHVSGSAMTVVTSIDAARSLAAVVSLSGRPTVCRPGGSTMNEPAC